jgi:RNA polymerase sigma factor (sigma-70 family)
VGTLAEQSLVACPAAVRSAPAGAAKEIPMPSPSLHTAQLHNWLTRMRAGDLSAREELLRGVCGRLERLAHKMLRRFPAVRRWVEPEDVLQNALLRLLRALQAVRPESVREFFGLAAEQMRRELLDLVRHFYGPRGHAAHHDSGMHPHGMLDLDRGPPDRREEPNDLERWTRFHEEVERLPVAEREVVSLIFYHGWEQAEVAELLQMSARTVRRRWESALLTLHARVTGCGEQG